MIKTDIMAGLLGFNPFMFEYFLTLGLELAVK